MSNFLLMILRFSRWFVTQVLNHFLLMRTYLKYRDRGTNGKSWCFKTSPEIVFSRKKNPCNHNEIYFNNMPLNWKNTQKHLGLYLDAKLNFSEHINEQIKKAVSGISVIKRLNVTLPRSSLLTVYKSFFRPHLHYGDVIYEQPHNDKLSKKLSLFSITQQ